MVPHQDSSFIHTSPLSCVGLWWALEDCTRDNGCLWAQPGACGAGSPWCLTVLAADGFLLLVQHSAAAEQQSDHLCVAHYQTIQHRLCPVCGAPQAALSSIFGYLAYGLCALCYCCTPTQAATS